METTIEIRQIENGWLYIHDPAEKDRQTHYDSFHQCIERLKHDSNKIDFSDVEIKFWRSG